MKNYIGTKVVNATLMDRGNYNLLRGWELPADENGDDEGYLVEYKDGGKPNHSNFVGYISWSPKAAFEAAYRDIEGPVQALTFGDALHMLKLGKRVARAGWNGKGMWLSMSGPIEGRYIGADKFWSPNNAQYANAQPNGEANVLPCITMKTADGSILMGWLASQTDMLAEDWSVIF